MSQEAACLISKTLRNTYADKFEQFYEFIKSRGDEKFYKATLEVKFFNRHAFINHPQYGPYLLNGSGYINFAYNFQLFFYKQTFTYNEEMQIRIAKHELAHFFHYLWKGPEIYSGPHNNDFMDISDIIAGERWDGAMGPEYGINSTRILNSCRWRLVPLRTVDNRRGYMFLSEPQPLDLLIKDRVA